jgi:hypothetical protein
LHRDGIVALAQNQRSRSGKKFLKIFDQPNAVATPEGKASDHQFRLMLFEKLSRGGGRIGLPADREPSGPGQEDRKAEARDGRAMNDENAWSVGLSYRG